MKLQVQILAILLALSSCFLFTFNNYLVKEHQLDTVDVVLLRSILQFILLFSIAKCKGNPLWPRQSETQTKWESRKVQIALISSSITGSVVIFLGYYAVRIIPLDDAIAIIFASPIFSILFEWLLVRKSQGIFYKLGFSLILIAGVILVLQPPFLHFHPEDQVEYSTSEYFGMAAALGAAIAGGILNATSWFVTKDVGPIVLSAYSGLSGFAISLIAGLTFVQSDQIMSSDIVNISAEQWGWIIFVAIMSIVAFWSQMASFQWIDASTMGALQTSEVLLAYLVQVLVMKDDASVLAIIGSVMIMISVSAISLTDKMLELLRKPEMKPDNILTEEKITKV